MSAMIKDHRQDVAECRAESRNTIQDAKCFMSADLVRLQRVFTNLLSNAVKFTPPGGHIAVEASCTSSAVVVTIKDDGVGVTPESLPHVFDGLQQDPRSSASSSRGLGLGLSFARHFGERHGRMIRAASNGPAKGATFTVELPDNVLPLCEGIGIQVAICKSQSIPMSDVSDAHPCEHAAPRPPDALTTNSPH